MEKQSHKCTHCGLAIGVRFIRTICGTCKRELHHPWERDCADQHELTHARVAEPVDTPA